MATPPPEVSPVEVSGEHQPAPGEPWVDELAPLRDQVLIDHNGGDPDAYLKLLGDWQVRSTLEQRRARITSREVVVEAGGPNPIDAEAADHLRAQLASCGLDAATKKMLVGSIVGYAVAECLFAQDTAGRVVLRALRVRRAGRFRFMKSGRLMMQRPREQLMPERKFWCIAFGAEDDDNLHGEGLGATLYWLVFFKRNAVKFWALFLDKFSGASALARLPPGAGEQEHAKVSTALDGLHSNGRMTVSKNVEVELVQAMRDSGGDYEKFIALLDAAISKVMVLSTMTTDDGASLAQGQVHEGTSEIGAKAESDLLTESFAKGPATWLTEWNFPGAATPIVYRRFESPEDATALATRDKALFDMGWRPTAARVLEVYGEGYEAAPQPTSGVNTGAVPATEFAEPGERARDLVDDALPALTDGWRQVLEPEIVALEELLASSGSLDEVRDKLGRLARRDPTGLVESLARSSFAARVAGEEGVESDGGR